MPERKPLLLMVSWATWEDIKLLKIIWKNQRKRKLPEMHLLKSSHYQVPDCLKTLDQLAASFWQCNQMLFIHYPWKSSNTLKKRINCLCKSNQKWIYFDIVTYLILQFKVIWCCEALTWFHGCNISLY